MRSISAQVTTLFVNGTSYYTNKRYILFFDKPSLGMPKKTEGKSYLYCRSVRLKNKDFKAYSI